MSQDSNYKWCFVPQCTNTSLKTPEKIFLPVPRPTSVRRQWAKMARREDAGSLTSTAPWFCCEDHFNLQEDTLNLTRYNMVGGRLLLKKGVLPHIFRCQGKNIERVRAAAAKRDLQRHISEALQSENESSEGETSPQHAEEEAAGTSDAAVQFQPETKEVYVQTVGGCAKSVEIQTDACMPLWESDSSDDNDGGRDSDATYVADSDSDDDKDQLSDEVDVQSLERMRILCRKNPKEYMGLNQEGLVVLELIASNITGVCSRQSRLTALDACFMVMVKIKHDRSFKMVGDDFGISRSYAGRLWNMFLPKITAFVKSFIFWPTEQDIRNNLPLAFKARFSRVTCIIDCLEIEIEKPVAAMKQSKTWSAYKNCNTIKYLVSIVPSGMINFISGGYGGRTSDMEIMETSGFLDALMPGMVVMADRGFKSIEPVLKSKGCFLIRPDSVASTEIPTARRVLFSKQVASLRVHVERAIRRIREYAMVKPHAVVESSLLPHLDRVLATVSGFVNLQHDLTKV